MTEKRFVSEDDCCGYYTEIIDNEKELDLSLHNPKKNLTIEELVNLLNELHKENMMLKEYNNKLMKQPLLFDVQTIPDTMKIMEANTQLEEENEQLKQELDYIQNSISEHIKHQKTELGQKALKEIIEDYNEWLLGHKELQE